MRINRFLALAGLGARRKCESLVWEGRVEVNGVTVISLSLVVDPENDRVICDGERVRLPRTFLYAIMNKPSGVIVSADDERGRKTVYELLPSHLHGKVRAVGRLDAGSEGLLLLTNDGLLAHALLHPKSAVIRTYLAWVTPIPSLDAILRLREGVVIGRGEKSGEAFVRMIGQGGSTAKVRLAIREGKNREIRRMFKAVGCRVLALRRIAFDGLTIGGLAVGQVRPLIDAEVELLRKAATREPDRAAGSPRRRRTQAGRPRKRSEKARSRDPGAGLPRKKKGR